MNDRGRPCNEDERILMGLCLAKSGKMEHCQVCSERMDDMIVNIGRDYHISGRNWKYLYPDPEPYVAGHENNYRNFNYNLGIDTNSTVKNTGSIKSRYEKTKAEFNKHGFKIICPIVMYWMGYTRGEILKFERL